MGEEQCCAPGCSLSPPSWESHSDPKYRWSPTTSDAWHQSHASPRRRHRCSSPRWSSRRPRRQRRRRPRRRSHRRSRSRSSPPATASTTRTRSIRGQRPSPPVCPLDRPSSVSTSGTEIEGYARYEGQSTCDPTPKVGTLNLRDLLLSRYPNTKSLGVSRGCDVGGQSEHKEGRAFDWGANVTNAAQVAAVEDFLAALFATDSVGHPHALARRMGVMYVIWNHQIWSASSASSGWKPYDGANPHTDHVHISLSWAGARAETSFWSGVVLVPEPPPTTSTTRRPRSTTTTRPATTSTTRRPRATTTSTSTSTTSSTTTIPPTTTTSTTLH